MQTGKQAKRWNEIKQRRERASVWKKMRRTRNWYLSKRAEVWKEVKVNIYTYRYTIYILNNIGNIFEHFFKWNSHWWMHSNAIVSHIERPRMKRKEDRKKEITKHLCHFSVEHHPELTLIL